MLYRKSKYLWGLALISSFALIGCGGGTTVDSNPSGTTQNITLPTSFSVNDGRLLAANCAQCHGTNGNSVNSWDSIAGKSDIAGEFYEDENALMGAVAHGFTQNEVDNIASWLKTLPKNNNSNDDNDD